MSVGAVYYDVYNLGMDCRLQLPRPHHSMAASSLNSSRLLEYRRFLMESRWSFMAIPGPPLLHPTSPARRP